jgi:hypothetical protein
MQLPLSAPPNPALLWAAVEAVATAVAALAAIIAAGIIILELRRIRREETSHKLRGYEIATELLKADEFLAAARAIQDDPGPGVTHSDWFDRYPPLLFRVLRTAEALDFLIQEKHLDEDFLMRLDGYRLGRLAKLVSAIEQSRESPRLRYWSTLYPNGKALLVRAEEWRHRSSLQWQFLTDPDNPADRW